MDIRHVVVLMLENRSFDGMLGMLYPSGDRFDGLTGTESNVWHKPDGSEQVIQVWKNPDLDARAVCIPDPDPGELFADIRMQLGRPGRGAVRHGRLRRQLHAAAGDHACARPVRGHALFHAGPGAGDQPARARLRRVRPVARLRAVPDLAQPLLRPCRDGERLRQQFAGAFPVRRRRCSSAWRASGKLARVFPRHSAGRDAVPALGRRPLPASASSRSSSPMRGPGRCRPTASSSRATSRTRSANQIPNDEHPPHNVAYGEALIASVYNAVRGGPGWKTPC